MASVGSSLCEIFSKYSKTLSLIGVHIIFCVPIGFSMCTLKKHLKASFGRFWNCLYKILGGGGFGGAQVIPILFGLSLIWRFS